jgi:hypothetical protein
MIKNAGTAIATTANMTKLEVAIVAEKRYANFIMSEGLKNGKRIALEIYQLFKKEATRRKGLELKSKLKRKKVRVKSVKKTKSGPPKIC